jgi:hypothetical protein
MQGVCRNFTQMQMVDQDGLAAVESVIADVTRDEWNDDGPLGVPICREIPIAK